MKLHCQIYLLLGSNFIYTTRGIIIIIIITTTAVPLSVLLLLFQGFRYGGIAKIRKTNLSRFTDTIGTNGFI